ncbi:MAG: hypothetical protein ACRESZ_18800 [Methylococcales bacterium]
MECGNCLLCLCEFTDAVQVEAFENRSNPLFYKISSKLARFSPIFMRVDRSNSGDAAHPDLGQCADARILSGGIVPTA